MSLDRILCLANSYKHEHRCVAGISLNTRKWVRLVGHAVPGCLTLKEASYEDGTEAAVLDVLEAELGERCGSNPHPEDVFLGSSRLRRIPPAGAMTLRTLKEYLSNSTQILGGYSDRVYAKKFLNARAAKSLELIKPDDLWWWIRSEDGKRKNRALFRLGHVDRMRYDLAVTDPRWLEKLNLLPAGIYPHSYFFKGKPPVTLLTLSLSEPFDHFHYKLVAGVVSLPS
jgi:hypothetical protein